MTSFPRRQPRIENHWHEIGGVSLIASALQALLCTCHALFFKEHGLLFRAGGAALPGEYRPLFRQEHGGAAGSANYESLTRDSRTFPYPQSLVISSPVWHLGQQDAMMLVADLFPLILPPLVSQGSVINSL